MQDLLHEKPAPLYTPGTEERLVFFLVFAGVLALTYGFLFLIDFLPEKPQEDTDSVQVAAPAVHETSKDGNITPTLPANVSPNTRIDIGEPYRVGPEDGQNEGENIDPYPTRIIFDALDGRNVTVLNPESRSIEALDTALLSGVVRHPDSADFKRTGTIFLFGHSSYLPNVMNKNFQAFNGIQKMTWGDTVRLQSSDREYVYRVDRVYETSANDAEVKIETGKAKLTLVTCDSFGAKSDRFVVEATLIEERSLDA